MPRTEQPIVYGNWKMNGTREEAMALADAAVRMWNLNSPTLGLFVPTTVLSLVCERVRGTDILVGGQDCHHCAQGAYTGSISAAMLKDSGAAAVLIGHSERRHGLGETDEIVALKIKAATAAGLQAVVCIGETESDWLEGRTTDILTSQLAYEPVWAIGTGKTPTADEISTTHAHIREVLAKILGKTTDVPILYGGSVNAKNAATIMKTPEVDGVLVGGASLDPKAFQQIYAPT
jgi:triosephosphate isomerase